MGSNDAIKIVASNRRALRDYFISEKYEAGIELKGAEVKSLRDGKVDLKDSFGRIEGGEALLYSLRISPYPQAGREAPDPDRTRKLLLHKREISRLYGKTQERGLTLIPLKVYFKKGKAKIELGLAQGKKTHDRREDIKKREADREMAQAARRSAVGAKRLRR